MTSFKNVFTKNTIHKGHSIHDRKNFYTLGSLMMSTAIGG